jgi:hypothetical protein
MNQRRLRQWYFFRKLVVAASRTPLMPDTAVSCFFFKYLAILKQNSNNI